MEAMGPELAEEEEGTNYPTKGVEAQAEIVEVALNLVVEFSEPQTINWWALLMMVQHIIFWPGRLLKNSGFP